MGHDVNFKMPAGAIQISSIDVGMHLNGYLLALPFINFLKGGWGALAITAVIVIIVFAAAAYMISKSYVAAIVADIDEF